MNNLEDQLAELKQDVRGNFRLGVKPLREELESTNKLIGKLTNGLIILFVIDVIQIVLNLFVR